VDQSKAVVINWAMRLDFDLADIGRWLIQDFTL